MSNQVQLQDAILKAIDALTQQRIDKLQLDKTVTAVIVTCTNALTREYKCSYNGGNITTYAAEGTTYTNGQSVYVLIPQGDMTKRKVIIGESSAKEDDENISFVSSALSDYNLIGKNAITDKKQIQPVGLHSYKKEEYKLLYDYATRLDDTRDYLGIEVEELNNNLQQAEALMIEASFQTRLPKAHKISQDGLYGLQFVLAFEDRNSTRNKYEQFLPEMEFQSKLQKDDSSIKKLIKKLIDQMNEILANTSLSWDIKSHMVKTFSENIKKLSEEIQDDSAEEVLIDFVESLEGVEKEEDLQNVTDKFTDKYLGKLSQLKIEIDTIWQNAALSLEEKKSQTQGIVEQIRKLAEEITIPVVQGTIADLLNHIEGIQQPEDVEDVFDDMQVEYTGKIKYISYIIDSNNMTGNPFRFTSWSEQYQIFPIDIENFLYIDSILFYSKNFVEKDNIVMADSWGTDIFLKDIEVYPLKKIDATNGNYKLGISMPQGSTFKGNTSEDKLDIVVKMIEKNVNNLSDNTTFYWFKEDNRVTAESDNFQMYGGAGWAWLKDKGNNYTLYTSAYENRAYENKYLCVAVYKESVILKTYFTLYNEAARRNIQIISSLGAKFSFDRGKPVLTCAIDGKSEKFEEDKLTGHADNLFRFIWSKIDEYNNTTIFSETYEQLQQRYEELKKTPGVSYHDLTALKNQMLSLKDVSWNKNVLIYPVSQIDNNAKFKCSVYLKDTPDGDEYSVGSAEILLQNEGVASPTDYYITIENGDQVFQYSESGVAPNDKRYTDPLEIKPLTCHFFDPAGLEVNKDTYDVKWLVPLENSMIVVPTKGMAMNNANNKIEWYVEEIYPLAIDADYDYQALNNQVTAIVKYQGQEYQQESKLLFTKIGENGTNGTDIVAKISPKLEVKYNRLLSITTGKSDVPCYNDTQKTPVTSETVVPLEFDLYQRSTKLALEDKPKWSIAGAAKQSKFLSIPNSLTSQIDWSEEYRDRKFRYQIIKADIQYDKNDYYAFYPMPVIEYHNAGNLEVSLDKTTTIKSVTYNADGRNPLYNKNQFIELKFNYDNNKEFYIVWTAEGGEPELSNSKDKVYDGNPKHAAFTLLLDSKEEQGSSTVIPAENNLKKVYILPNDIYTGEYTNNLVHAAIYTSKTVYENGGNTICDVYVPIHMSLNVYGLKSLNAWDGNHVEINEDENYVLAPQIGAGKKNNKNQFTGILMGTSQTYDQKEEQVGLLGYSEGKQSIWLDAETGKAVFGLPEQQATQENQFTEGRIELVPGGESKIGQWRVGSRAIYNMTVPDAEGDGFTGVEPIRPYGDYAVRGAQIAIPQEAQGIILNANPAYASYKGKPLTKANSKIDFDNANAAIREGDSFEVEIDPSKDSAFSIYRHTKWDKGVLTNDWHRYPLVGINAQGQFYTNAIENEESSMGIGKIGAFGTVAADGKYVGAQFGYDKTNLFKFFISTEGKDDTINKTLFLTAGTDPTNEYTRPLSMNFKSINLYASNSSKSQISDHRIELSTKQLVLGQKDKTSLDLTFTNSEKEYNRLYTQTNLAITIPKNRTFSIENHGNDVPLFIFDNKEKNNNNKTSLNYGHITLSGGLYINTDKEIELEAKTKAHLGSKYFDFSLDYSTGVGQLASDNGSALTINRDTGKNSSFVDNYGISITAKQGGGIKLMSENAVGDLGKEAIRIEARLNNNIDTSTYMTFTPEGQGFSTFSITSGCGNIWSEKGGVSGYNGLKLSAFAAPWAIFPSVKPGTNRSIEASNDIFSNRNIQGADFYWLSNKTGQYNGKDYTSSSLWAHIDALYSLLRETRTYANNRANEAESNAKAYTESYAAPKSHSHNYASATHTHDISISKSWATVAKTIETDAKSVTWGIGGSGPNRVLTSASVGVTSQVLDGIELKVSSPK